MSSTINNLTQRSPIDGTEYLVLATSGANWKAQTGGQEWVFGDLTVGANRANPNEITLTGTSSGSSPIIAVTGGDAAISCVIKDKGAGGIVMQSNGVNVLTATNASPSVVNYVSMIGGTTGIGPAIQAVSVNDANVVLNLAGQGTGGVTFCVNLANNFTMNGAAATMTPSIAVQGSDTNISLALIPKGTGLLQVNGSSSFTANGTGAAAITGFAPAGAGATPASWLTIIDNGGTTRYIPCF